MKLTKFMLSKRSKTQMSIRGGVILSKWCLKQGMLIYGWKPGLAFTFGEVESGCEHESFCEASHRHSVY